MGSRFLVDLADWCRAAGLATIEVDGWQFRARSSGGYEPGRPICVCWHHTASTTSPENDVDYMCYGSSDAPIANLLLDRSGMVWVMAGGATNTNGKGGPYTVSRGTIPKDSMNTYGISIEAANDGVGERWPQQQIDSYFALSLVLTDGLGLAPTDICEHQVWAPDRKVDPAVAEAVNGPWQPTRANSSGTWTQRDVLDELLWRAGQWPPTPPKDDDVQVIELRISEADAVFLAYKVGDFILWAEWVNGNDPAQLARLEAYRAANTVVYTMSVENLSGVGLLGPVPSGDRRYNWSRSDFGNVIGAQP